MGRKKNIIIKDSLFHKLWDEALKIDDKSEYLNAFTSPQSAKRIAFAIKYGIKEDKALDLLEYIYKIANTPFTDVYKKIDKPKATLSHELCIPIRTLEDWVSQKSKCPSYTKLLIMKHYNLFKIPSGITLESEQKEIKEKKALETKYIPTYEEIKYISTRHRTYIEEQRKIEEHKKESRKRKQELPYNKYLDKHRK